MKATAGTVKTSLVARNYDLAATLTSGQTFRWESVGNAWEGVVGGHWVRVRQGDCGLEAETVAAGAEGWLRDYFQTGVDLECVLREFPDDAPMYVAVSALRGLRLLRQDPWECLASFILSSTKQIVQIRAIVATLSRRMGHPVAVPDGVAPLWAFPTSERIATATEDDLRSCKMGFRAPYLGQTARRVARGEMDLAAVGRMHLEEARMALMSLPGVGRKIADCVLLFAYGFAEAFPVDVWIEKVMRQTYFRGRRVRPERLERFVRAHFGAHAGYAQQYLFHYARTQGALPVWSAGRRVRGKRAATSDEDGGASE